MSEDRWKELNARERRRQAESEASARRVGKADRLFNSEAISPDVKAINKLLLRQKASSPGEQEHHELIGQSMARRTGV